MKVSIIGNAARNIGIATAADLALAGHEVSLCVPENASEQFSTVMDGKGVLVQGDVKQLSAGTTGFANFAYAGHDEKTALEDAAVVILDLPLPELSTRFANLVDHLPREAVVHVQSYGCWAAAMLGRVAIVAGRNDILVTEAKAPTIAARFDGSVVTAGVLRRKLEDEYENQREDDDLNGCDHDAKPQANAESGTGRNASERHHEHATPLPLRIVPV